MNVLLNNIPLIAGAVFIVVLAVPIVPGIIAGGDGKRGGIVDVIIAQMIASRVNGDRP